MVCVDTRYIVVFVSGLFLVNVLGLYYRIYQIVRLNHTTKSADLRTFQLYNVTERTPEYVYQANTDFSFVKNPYLSTGILETEDRIISQMNIGPGGFSPKKNKTIVLIGSHEKFKKGQEEFIKRDCNVRSCVIVKKASFAHWHGNQVDAIVFSPNVIGMLPLKLPHQVWILSMLESPLNTHKIEHFNNKINWTMTYRRDSTIVTPYFKYLQDDQLVSTSENVDNVSLEEKSKLVAWIVSNCNSKSGRIGFVKELQKYISVDIYGHCESLSCSGNCKKELKKYKFYLAFENSLCKDYITEKLLVHALENNVVPIVMGAPYEDYMLSLPEDSFIHVDNFTSAQHLAEYLIHLNNTDQLYKNYFKWRESVGGFIDTKSICRVCAMLHADLPKQWYTDIQQWWTGGDTEAICRYPRWSDSLY